LNTFVSASDEDVVWLTEAGAQRWVVITHDDRIRYNQLEKQAALAAKVRFFSITPSIARHFAAVGDGTEQICGSSNPPIGWLRRIDCLRRAT
jgi:hypothetical protein